MNWKKVLMLFGVAVALAIFEIQIEGPSGWAEKLPCWRAAPDSWQQTIYGAFMNGKSCDGFHLSELALLLLMFHLPFAWGTKWSKSLECELLASFFLTSICWDFLWFVFNPAYGWSNFAAGHIWWHKHWWGLFPRDYYGGMVPIGILVFLAGWFGRKQKENDSPGTIRVAWTPPNKSFWPSIRRIIMDLLGLVGLTVLITIVAEIIRLVV